MLISMAKVTCEFFSESLGVNTSMQVLLPQETGTDQIGVAGTLSRENYPILYLLHGWSDDESIWTRQTSIERYVADLRLIVVMPRVELSYYQNMVTGMRFWDFIAEELPSLCRQWFPVSPRREDTFAAGLSMGGYGAFRLGLGYPDKFAAVASLSGALDITEIREAWQKEPERRPKLEAIWGKDGEAIPADADLLNLAEALAKNGARQPRLFQWCGTEDFLYSQNTRFRDQIGKLGLQLDYHEGPGDHAWEHWDRQIQAVLEWLSIK